MKLTLNRPEAVKTPLPLPERPRLAPDVKVHAPVEAGAPWIVQFGAQRYLRVGAGMARLLSLADGAHTAHDIAGELGRPWTPELVNQGLLRAQKTELLQDTERKTRKARRFAFVPPLTVQFTVVRPEHVLGRFRPLMARLANRGWAIALAVVAAAGLLCVLAQGSAAKSALESPISIEALLALMVVTYLGTVLHELAHGMVLSHYGGAPSRMGVMLFYLTPAFFCDVSDGWRLPRSTQRVRIALAGITTQAAIGGVAAIASAVAAAEGDDGLRDLLLLLAVTNYASGVFNAVPFVKLDGYLALMSHLDISHLRDRSMTDARRLFAKVLFGGRYERALPNVGWAPLFGFACILFPLYVVSMAFTVWGQVLEDMGMVGAAIVSVVVGYLLLRLYGGALKLGAEARTAGASRLRRITVSTAALGALAAIMLGVTLPYTVSGGFVEQRGRLVFVSTGATDQAAIEAGATVRLESGGVLLHRQLGEATVASVKPVDLSAPLAAFVPVKGIESVRIPASGIVLDSGRLPADTTGLASVEAGRRTLASWLYQKYLAPFWR